MYSVPNHIDKNKIFIVQRSEIDGRLDPHYNKPEYSELHDLLNALPCGLSTLRNQSNAIFSGITPQSGGDAYSVSPDAIPFVRSGDFSETNQIDFSSLLYLSPEIHYGVMASSRLQMNDLLFAIVGATIGKIGVYVFDREANINQAICGVRLKDGLNPFYVQAFYQSMLGQKLIERAKRPVARANLNLEEIGNLPIPMVDEGVQWQIVDKIKLGISGKLQKECEAQQLLDSIDAYLLDELGVNLPNDENNLKDRKYFICYKELMNKRIDPKKYSPNVKRLFACITQSIYPCHPLSDFIIGNCAGDWGIDGNVETIPEDYIRCLTLRAAEFDNQYNLNIQPEKAKYRLIKSEKYNSIKLNINDILIEKSGGSEDQPVGRVALIEDESYNDVPLSFSNFLMKISVKDIDSSYLYFFLKTMYHIGLTDSMQSQTNGIRNLIVQEYLEQMIICPPLSKQREIADHIYSLRQQAKALQAEGKSILENAKKEVERMILGE